MSLDYSNFFSPGITEATDIIEFRTWSDSDFSRINNRLLNGLRENDIPYILTIKSAHRTPDAMIKSAQAFPNIWLPENLQDTHDTTNKKIQICLAAAWGSAHIAGMTAAETSTPVIAIPLSASSTGTIDALFSMINMPPGIPNGVTVNQESAVSMTEQMYQLNLPSDYNKISLNIDACFAKDIQDQLLEELWIEIDSSWQSPICINTQDLDLPSCKNTIIWQAPIIVPTMKQAIDLLNSDVNNTKDNYASRAHAVIKYPKNVYTLFKWVQKIQKLNKPGLYMWLTLKNNPRFTNALIYAAQIIGMHNPEVREKVGIYKAKLRDEVLNKDEWILSAQLKTKQAA